MKIRVAVIFGGMSVEHEVSIISALQAYAAFDTERYELLPVYITKKGEMYTGEPAGRLEEYKNIPTLLSKCKRVIFVNEGGKCQLVQYPQKKFGNSLVAEIDVAFPIVHGTNVEDGNLQGYLHTIGVPFVGSDVLGSALGMDKLAMKAVLAYYGMPVLPAVVVTAKEITAAEDKELARIEKEIGYPLIVKPINLGSSVGIKKATDHSGLKKALDNAFQFANKVLIEHAVMKLREINCAVLGDGDEAEASECEEPFAMDEILSYEDKYINGGKSKSSGMASLKRQIPANISEGKREEIRSLAVEAFKALGCAGVARIDFLLDGENDKVYFNEINTIPGSLSFYLWEPVGVKYPQLLDRMVKLAIKRDREEKELCFTFETNILQNVSLGGAKGAKGGKFGGK